MLRQKIVFEVIYSLRILVIRPGAIGDTLLTLPIIQALRKRFNAEHITLIGNATVLPLASASGIVEATSNYESLQWSELFSTTGIQNPTSIDMLQQIDLAICWMRDSEDVVRHNLQAMGVQRLLIAPGRPPDESHVHMTHYLAETVGLALEIGEMMTWQLPSLGQVDRTAELGSRTIAIHPGSGGARKCWPVSAFTAVSERLWERDYSILLLGGPADAERLAMLQHALPSPPAPTMLRILKDAPLLEVARQLQQCQCYLGNDSGITHLAAMLGIATLALFGPSEPAVWRPLGPKVDILHRTELAQLSVDLVIQRLFLHLQ